MRKLVSSIDNLSAETRGSALVAAGLIIAATYQTVLSPPGGLTSGDSNGNMTVPAGKANMNIGLFFCVIMLNTVPFITSVALMILLLPKSKFFVIYSLPLSYGLSAGIITPTSSDLVPILRFCFRGIKRSSSCAEDSV